VEKKGKVTAVTVMKYLSKISLGGQFLNWLYFISFRVKKGIFSQKILLLASQKRDAFWNLKVYISTEG